jgi:AraC-like DNA-binding protein
MDLRVQKTQQMMRDNLQRDLSLGKFARSVNLSVWRFCHVFRSEVGMSPYQYLRLLRMERAKQLLESSFLSVKEIGHRVGLNDESHFARDFKKAYGVPPTRYRLLFNSGNSNDPDSEDVLQSESRDRITETAKRSILPSLNVLAYVVALLELISDLSVK